MSLWKSLRKMASRAFWQDQSFQGNDIDENCNRESYLFTLHKKKLWEGVSSLKNTLQSI